MPYYVYMIQCQDNSFYTGYTKNLRSRMKRHMNGKAARYTQMHKPLGIVHTEKFKTRSEAMRREKQVKRLNHNQKAKLINSQTRQK